MGPVSARVSGAQTAMTKYPTHLTRDQYHLMERDFDTTICWSVDYDEQPDTRRSGHQMSSFEAELLNLEVTVDDDGQKDVQVDIRAPAPIEFSIPDVDDQERMYRIQQALFDDDETVEIDGEPIDDVLGWD